MKKLTSLFFCVAMLFTMSACGGSKVSDDALDTLEAAIQNLADMKSADYSATFVMEADGEKNNAALHGSYSFATETPQASAIIDMETDGQKQEGYLKFYLKDNFVYMNMMDFLKSKNPLSDMTNEVEIPSVSLDKDTLKIPKDKIKEYLSEASIKGDVLTISVDPAKLKEAIGKEATKNDTLGSIDNVNILEFKMVINLKDGMMSKADINLEMSKKDDEKDTAKINITLEFKNINKVKEVAFPDLSDYLESSDSSYTGLE